MMKIALDATSHQTFLGYPQVQTQTVAEVTQSAEFETVVQLQGVGKRFLGVDGEYQALEGVDLAVREGEFVCIVGPSGCGKTTLLRILAGLERHTDGRVIVCDQEDGRPFTSVVFQENSIFPWLSVRDNAAFGLRMRNSPDRLVDKQVTYFLDMVGLTKFAKSYPHQLSGGMKQRVSIARAFANDPQVLLMDEPFSALDEQNRTVLQEELLRIWDETRKTVIFITHSIDEALFLGDRVVVMSGSPGRVLADTHVPFKRPRRLYELKSDPCYNELVVRIAGQIRTGVGQSK
ncbi:MAG: ABC transporter ATP-binding protein [Pigmentiphaga sp.]